MERALPSTCAPEFSVVIPSYCGRDTVGWCLEGLQEQEGGIPFEVLVVESGEAGYVAELTARFEWARFIIPPGRLYSGQARNVGAAFASGETLIFLDADCRPSRGWLEAFRDCRDRGYDVVSGSLDNGSPESATGTTEYLVSHSSYSSRTGQHEITESTAASGNLMVRRSVFERSGGFAGTMRANDFIFSRWLHDAGVKILFCSRASAMHLDKPGFREYFSEQVRRGRWNGMARLEHGLRGSLVGRFPPLAFLLFPLRLYRLVVRCLRYRVVTPLRLVRLLPSVSAGVFAWTWGFFEAALHVKQEIMEERDPLPEGWSGYRVEGGSGQRPGA